jgi:hypothetical protein
MKTLSGSLVAIIGSTVIAYYGMVAGLSGTASAVSFVHSTAPFVKPVFCKRPPWRGSYQGQVVTYDDAGWEWDNGGWVALSGPCTS